jgi:GNAT superfamily N-acetyltransferase
MFTDLSIRPVTRLDYPQWLPLWDGYNAFYGRSGPTALPAKITQITWARFFDAYEPLYALVAETNGQLVGLAHYLFHRSTITITPTCYLQDLFTSQPAHGKGVGKALIKGVYEQAKNTGSSRIYWHTHENQQNRPPPLRPSRQKLRFHRLPQSRMDSAAITAVKLSQTRRSLPESKTTGRSRASTKSVH